MRERWMPMKRAFIKKSENSHAWVDSKQPLLEGMSSGSASIANNMKSVKKNRNKTTTI